MNSKTLSRITEIARAMKPEFIKRDEQFHLSFAVRQGKIIRIGKNNYNKRHNCKRFGKYSPYKTSFLKNEYIACQHSECHLAVLLGLDSWDGMEIVNVRLNNEGHLRMAAPCKNCEKNVINYFQPKRVFFSTSEGNYAELT